ncbi:MAG: hypothetical protein Q9160_007731 [Pyrenula sp. 1 TL-2023]
MADLLTQLQICFDQLATQFYATTSYLTSRHTLCPPTSPSDPHLRSELLTPGPEDTNPDLPQLSLRPDSPSTFAAAQRELAQDLVAKEKQIEYLIENLPGSRATEEEQEARLRELEGQLRRVEAERKAKRREVRQWVGRLDRVIVEGTEKGKG